MEQGICPKVMGWFYALGMAVQEPGPNPPPRDKGKCLAGEGAHH